MKHNDIVEECPFCDTTQIKSVVNDYGDVIAFEPLNPVVKGHLLVVPKKHVADFTEDIDVTARVMQQAALIAGYLGGEYNLITSKGHNATQSVFHLHVHLVPRHQNDELMLPWTGKDALTQAHTRGYEEGREEMMARVLGAIPDAEHIDTNKREPGDTYADGYRNGHITGVTLAISEVRKRVRALTPQTDDNNTTEV